jgi:hypothetical protein
VFQRTHVFDAQAIENLPAELEASRASRKRAWENLQEMRRMLKDTAGIELPPPAPAKPSTWRAALLRAGCERWYGNDKPPSRIWPRPYKNIKSWAVDKPGLLPEGDRLCSNHQSPRERHERIYRVGSPSPLNMAQSEGFARR